MKKLVSLLLTFTLSILLIGMVGCGEKTGKVMNVSLNPEVEFVLDSNNKVVTVNALNDEGNYVISQVSFEGLTAEDAVDAFIKVSKDNGFLIQGSVSAGDNQIEIEISGDEAQKLYDKVKTSAQEKFNELQLTATTVFEKIDKDYLKDVVEDCFLNLKESEIAKKSEKELIDLIKQSREETKELLSQELKEFYYSDRAKAVQQARIQGFIDAVNESGNALLTIGLNQIQTLLNTFTSKYSEFKTEFVKKFLAEDSEYQVKMQDFIAKKKEILKQRLEGIDTSALESQLEKVEDALEGIKDASMTAISAVDSAISTALSSIETVISTVFANFDASAKISVKVGEVESNFIVNFKTENSSFVANTYWETLNPNAQA
jgi:hypothetical protein